MRPTVLILIFLILLNGWAGLLQQYGVDDHLGINAEVGEHDELENASASARNVSEPTGGGITGSLVGTIATAATSLKNIIIGYQPAVQMITNITPPGIAEEIIIWAFGVIPIVAAMDILNFIRGLR